MQKTTLNIQMVDLRGQYREIKEEIDAAVQEVLESSAYINGPKVKEFQASFEEYLGVKQVIPCGNGTDALQIALMAVGLQPGDEVIVPAFTYVATAEVIALLRLKPVMVDVDPGTFNLTAGIIEKAITPKTKAIVPVNLFGQSCDMEPIMELAHRHDLFVIEDNAQAIGADYTFSDGRIQKAGAIGHIGCTSFYPSKNLGCYGDGGAIYTNDEELGTKCRMIANHGQTRRYYHDMIGVNSRLDAIQAAILNIKLKNLDNYAAARQRAASWYDRAFNGLEQLQIPERESSSSHVFHQYTLVVKEGDRDELQAYLREREIPSMIYYPVPLYKQKAYSTFTKLPKFSKRNMSENEEGILPVTEELCKKVLSLPMHTELDEGVLGHIADAVIGFFK